MHEYMLKIVQLKKADVSVLSDIRTLLKQLSTQIGTATPAGLKKMLGNPDIEIWVARDGARVVGMGTLIVLHKLYVISSNVEDIVVNEEYRGQGLGMALMKKLLERARAHGAERVEFTSNPSRTAGNTMYQKLGFEKRDTNVYRLKL